MLEIKNFGKTYNNGKQAVENINIEVAAGDIFAFIGHNGAGKSTTIKAVVGVLDFEQGEIYIEGLSIKTNPIDCKSITAYIPDNPDLYEHLTGIQYLNFISDVFGLSSSEREQQIKKYAEAFEIMGNLGDLISSYSHGMKQKIALIGAVIHKPKLLILDEPFVGLDPKAAIVLRNIMKDLCTRGSAVFFSTHVLDVAQKLCNEIAMIHHGKIAINGEMEQLVKEQSLEDLFMEVLENG
ncbi:ABC transporter ATP-binding protein [Brochothrix thermosphacta]|uniref:ABC transporter ATP-binding protein n=1 Tax=Brochothrix thermosphacta TaxID=2756 RepID=UPI00083FB297|nr:ABC transporter ATP-binding protein [Brochothrix thermosphacta]ODJ65521.1 ABC transporter [Brochothrix thermosphacta]